MKRLRVLLIGLWATVQVYSFPCAFAQPSSPSTPNPPSTPPPIAATNEAVRPAAPSNHSGLPEKLESDQNHPAADLPAGTIEVTLVDGQGNPLAGIQVRLGINFEKIAEGETRSERTALTDRGGKATFEGLQHGTDYSYRVTTRNGQGLYASSPFNLKDVGQRVLLHVYPVTSNLREALIGMRGFVYIEPRDDVFQVEVLYRVFNVGGVTWVPENIKLRLPEGFKAFKAAEAMTDSRFEEDGSQGVQLLGTYIPGQHDVSFRFQIPREPRETANFLFGALPRTAELRVIVEANTHTGLQVTGFEPAQVATNQSGQRVLITRKLMDRSEADQLKELQIQLTGLPVPGVGRWVAALLSASLMAIGGVFGAIRPQSKNSKGAVASASDLVDAQELLLAELVELETVRQSEKIGPKAYQESRRQLLEALTRIVRMRQSTDPSLSS